MQIKRFEAQTMAEALKLVKREFGPEAVILSARTLRAEGGLLASLRRPLVEVTAATDQREGEPAAPALPGEIRTAVGMAAARQVYRQAAAKPLTRRRPAEANGEDKAGRVLERAAADIVPRLRGMLRRQGLSDEHIASLLPGNQPLPEFEAQEGQVPEVEALARILAERQLVAAPQSWRAGRRRVVAAVGTAGVGKTTTLVKIAARFRRRHGGRIALLGLDTRRVGAAEQLQTYGRLLSVPCHVADTEAQLSTALEGLGETDLLLVDTPGLAPGQIEALADLGRTLGRIGDVEIWWLASATTRSADLALAGGAYRSLPLKRLMITRLDETRQPAAMLEVALKSGLPIAGISTGPEIPGDIAWGDARVVARLVLGQSLAPARQPLASPAPVAATAATPAVVPVPKAPGRALGEAAAPTSGRFVALANSNLFHCTDCIWIQNTPSQHLIVLASPDEARRQMYRPCRTCNPEQRRAFPAASPHAPQQLTACHGR
jgi:flagellar biosynthesis protein FlhF